MKPRQSSVSKGTTRKEPHRHGSFGPGRSLPDDFKYIFSFKLQNQSEKPILLFPFSSWDNWVLGRTSSNYAADKWLSQTRTSFFLFCHCHPHCPDFMQKLQLRWKEPPTLSPGLADHPRCPRGTICGVLSPCGHTSRGALGKLNRFFCDFSGLDPHWAPLFFKVKFIDPDSFMTCLLVLKATTFNCYLFLKGFLRFSQAWSRTVCQSTSLI